MMSLVSIFKNEYGRFTWKVFGSDWHETLFATVVEAVEFMAIQWGLGDGSGERDFNL